MVGLSKPLKIEWLNETASLILDKNKKEEMKEKLNEYLSFEIDSPIVLRKTRELLINTWMTRSENCSELNELALTLYYKRSPVLPLHWCMLLVSYPIFSDVCALIGKISTIEESFTSTWIREKLNELWGERATVIDSVPHILRTMVNLGVIEKERTSTYRIRKQRVSDEETIKLFIKTLFELKQKAYYEVSEFSSVPQMFPFVFDVTYEMIYTMGDFSFANFGGKRVLTK